MTVLESVNFLSTSGPCYIVLGMEEQVILDCLATRLTLRGSTKQEGETPEQVERVDAERRQQARLWLEKLVQIRVAVPRITPDQCEKILGGTIPAPINGEPHDPDSLRRGWTFAKLHRLFKSSPQITSAGMLAWTVIALLVTLIIGGIWIGETLPTFPSRDPPKSAEIPEWVSKVKLQGKLGNEVVELSVVDSKGPEKKQAVPTLDKSVTAESKPREMLRANEEGSFPSRAISLNIDPGQKPLTSRTTGLIAVLVGISGIILGTLGLKRELSVTVEVSNEFRDNIRTWSKRLGTHPVQQSFPFEYLLDGRFPIPCGAGQDDQIVQNLRSAPAVCVAAQDGHFPIRALSHEIPQYGSHGHASEMWRPVVISRLALKPAGLAKRRNVCQNDNVLAAIGRFRQDRGEMFGRFVSESIEFQQQSLL